MHEIIVYDTNGDSLINLAQWDKNVKIFMQNEDIDKAYKIHFFNQNCKEAMVVESSYKDGLLSAIIPNDLLTESLPIIGYIYVERNNEHKSIYGFRIAVIKRPKPSNYVYSDEKNYITFEQVLEEAKSYAANAFENAEFSKECADHAKDYKNAAKESEENSALSEEASSNSAESASQSANTASVKARECATSAKEAESYAHGGTNTRPNEETDNAMAYSQKAKEYADSWKGSLLPQGSVSFIQLPTSGNVKGHMYNVNDAFVTDSRFKEGAGYSYPAGTNVYWTSDGKWDCLSGVLTKEVTQAEYDALSEAEKMSGTIYYISDADNTLGSATDTVPGVVIVDKALSDTSENPVQNKAVKAAIDLKADKDSPALTGNPTAPTPSQSSNDGRIATTGFVKSVINALIGGAPETLDTLKEIADALAENETVVSALNSAIGNKVDKVSGKGLSANDYTTSEKNKLKGIASGAEVNVQADWNATDTGSDAFIKNKPSSLPASDVYPWAKAASKPSYSKSEVGLGNVPNVTTNNQTPTFSEAASRTNIVSGETLSTVFGKIKKWFTDLKTVAFTGSYDDLSNKPSIPSVGNGTVTIKQAGVSKGSFTMNQSGSATIELSDNNTIYSLPLASSSARGGVKTGYSQNGKNYPVQLSNEQMYVNVPWTDTNTTYGTATQSTNGLMSAADKKKLDGVSSEGDILKKVYPVGSIYMSVSSTNPGTLFGGTWVSWGSGRVPVGVNAGDGDFKVAEKTGGEKTHSLTAPELPNHKHYFKNEYGAYVNPAVDQSTAVTWGASFVSDSAFKLSPSSDQKMGGTTDQPHNNLQPYITCYMWKRTA